MNFNHYFSTETNIILQRAFWMHAAKLLIIFVDYSKLRSYVRIMISAYLYGCNGVSQEAKHEVNILCHIIVTSIQYLDKKLSEIQINMPKILADLGLNWNVIWNLRFQCVILRTEPVTVLDLRNKRPE